MSGKGAEKEEGRVMQWSEGPPAKLSVPPDKKTHGGLPITAGGKVFGLVNRYQK